MDNLQRLENAYYDAPDEEDYVNCDRCEQSTNYGHMYPVGELLVCEECKV